MKKQCDLCGQYIKITLYKNKYHLIESGNDKYVCRCGTIYSSGKEVQRYRYLFCRCFLISASINMLIADLNIMQPSIYSNLRFIAVYLLPAIFIYLTFYVKGVNLKREAELETGTTIEKQIE